MQSSTMKDNSQSPENELDMPWLKLKLRENDGYARQGHSN